MKIKIRGKKSILLVMLIAATCTLHAHDCSGGADCNSVPNNNTGAHALAGLLAAGTGAMVILNNNNKRKKKKEEEKKEDIDLEKEFIATGEDEADEEEEGNKKEKDKPRSFFDAPLGTDPPVDNQ